jgi:hypothetical protein
MLPAVLPPLGSVGLTAVELSRRLTVGKIICAGLDFSFTPDKFHARGTPGHRALLNSRNRLRSIYNHVAYSQSSVAAVSKVGLPVYTNPALKNYRALFEQEFGGDSRIFDIEGTGLPLGVKTLSIDDAMDLLVKGDSHFSTQRRRTSGSQGAKAQREEKKENLNSFIDSERKLLEELRGLLTGEAAADDERVNELIGECDYLWAHFPDYNASRRPAISDISFLKRLRTEIDPMLKLLVLNDKLQY